MLAAEDPEIACGLLLLSYPLHPPKRPDQLRTGHFPALRTPAVFVHGDEDPFGTPEEIEAAARLTPAPNRLILIRDAGHDLKKGRFEMASLVNALLGRPGETG
jgi:predicted alpha/beta-hydrolase family hydrolase